METLLASYKVAIVEQGNEALWRTYWLENSAGNADDAPSALGRFELIDAASVEEAISLAQRSHPDCTVMLAGGEHPVS